MLFTWPQPTEDELDSLYSLPLWQEAVDPVRNPSLVADSRMRCALVEELCGKGRLLEVGPGGGAFLREARAQGYEVFGVERDPSLARMLEAEFGDRVVRGELGHAPLAGKAFDVVALWNVFEHLGQPGEMLKEIYALLRPGGRLFLNVPNIESLEARVLGGHWLGWWIPLHLFHYSVESLTELLNAANMIAVYVGWEQSTWIAENSAARWLGKDTSDWAAYCAEPGVTTRIARRLAMKRFRPGLSRCFGRLCSRVSDRWPTRSNSLTVCAQRPQ